MERDDPQRAIRGPVRPASEASVRRGLGPKRFEAEWVVGAEADPWHLLADIAGLADAAHLAGSRLRADYGTLTPREIAVLRLLAVGRSDQEIASELAMSPKTASVHVSNIKAKLGAETRIEAALRAQALVAATGR
jgi:DNA-binding CsgD family transcriptional regulator